MQLITFSAFPLALAVSKRESGPSRCWEWMGEVDESGQVRVLEVDEMCDL